MESLRFQGTLEKQGKVKTWAWKKYWFILKDDQLSYVRDQDRVSSQGHIDLSQAQSIRVSSCNHGYPIEVVTKSRTHYLSASSAEIRDKWIKLLQDAMTLEGRRRESMTSVRASCNSINSMDEDSEVMYESVDNMGELCPTASDSSGYSSMSGRSGSRDSIPSAGERTSRNPDSTIIDSPPRDTIYNNPIYNSMKLSSEKAEAETNNNNYKVRMRSDVVESGDYDELHQGVGNSPPKKNHKALTRVCPSRPISGVEAARLSGVSQNTYAEVGVPTSEGAGAVVRRRSSSSSSSIASASRQSSHLYDYASVAANNQKSPRQKVDSDAGYDEVFLESQPKTRPPPPPPPAKTPKSCDRPPSASGQPRPTIAPKPARLSRLSSSGASSDTGSVSSPKGSASEDIQDQKSCIPDLPYPRRELTWTSAFDKIRLFIAHNRGPNELYPRPKTDELDGAAIQKLREFLDSIT